MKRISRLQFITDSAQVAMSACMGGVDWVQLRMKNGTDDEIRREVANLRELCRTQPRLIINDRVHLAKELGTDGVHIGKEDMHPAEARELLGENAIIGCTANTIEDILQLSSLPIDYIGLGPFRHTTTKQNLSPILGLEGYEAIMGTLKRHKSNFPPVVAIGGIEWEDISGLMFTGIHGIAVSGAIGRAADVAREAKAFATKVSCEAMGRYKSKDAWMDGLALLGELGLVFGDARGQ